MPRRSAVAPRPAGSRATALPPEERRASILAAALPLVVAHGPSVTTRQIAEAAGIAEGTIFRVFPDKDSLLHAVVEAARDPEPVEQALAEIDPTLPLRRRLELAVVVMQRRLRDIWQLVSALGLPGGPPQAANRPFRGLVAIFESERDAIGCSPEFAAQALRALTLAMTHTSIAPRPLPDPDQIVGLFLDGVSIRSIRHGDAAAPSHGGASC